MKVTKVDNVHYNSLVADQGFSWKTLPAPWKTTSITN